MLDFSIEQNAEQIYHPKTKEYFSEVIQSYVSGSYRSAVVMLYSVVVCDLIYKLKDLKEMYNDEVAKQILEKIEEEQSKNPNSGGWEIVLIDEIKNRTYFLESADKINLDSLRLYRHLSAHPVLTQEDMLVTPNKETVRALIRNMLEGILVKNPIMSKKVFITILEDLERHKSFFTEDIELERYLESRYLKNTNKIMLNTLFKDFWGIVFNCKSEECDSNRSINYRTLKILYIKYKQNLYSYIEENKVYFNKLKEDEESILKYLIVFFSECPECYNLMEEHIKTRIESVINSEWEYKLRSPFLCSSMEEHFGMLIKDIHYEEYTYRKRFSKKYIISKKDRQILLSWANENDCKREYYDLMIRQFVYSTSFDAADLNFYEYVISDLEHFDREQLLYLLKGINENSQCNSHRNAKNNNSILKEAADKILGNDFNYEEKFPNVKFDEGKLEK
ncbi:hypothetical protein ACVNNN_17400 [Lysinibacillus fusiformis]|uniref:hypothetical protein n=1 Tax=Lysinibacillus sp. PWR01 TaxID=3342384 RepID=UPI00372CEE2F